MLIEIKSNIFRKEKIEFHKGLNIILGDDEASNSIGKSTALMVIDFAFGGNTYIKHHKDVVKNMGDHEILFCFNFDGDDYKFKRTTFDYENVIKCDNNYEEKCKIKLSEFNEFLQKKYRVKYENTTFRGLVSLYSRIWGKENYNIKKPLDIVPKSKDKDMIISLIKLYNQYSKISGVDKTLKQYEDKKRTIDKGMKLNYIPKINKTKYTKNTTAIDLLNDEIISIKNNLGILCDNPIEMSNKELLELNKEKTIISNRKSKYISKLNLVQFNISKRKKISKGKFKDLIQIFPYVNLNRLEEIENFHSNIIKYLDEEVKEEEMKLNSNIDILNQRISEIDSKISNILKVNDAPKLIVDKIVDSTTKLNTLEKENKFFKLREEIKNNIDTEKSNLEIITSEVLSNIEISINNKIKSIYENLEIDVVNAPRIGLEINSYDFNVIDNTGTGYAYTSMIALDLAIFEITKLPFIIHDTMLFKNIENKTMENLIDIYHTYQDRQVFIAIDESNKYGSETKSLIKLDKVIELDKESTLFKKVWNR
ncbi:hypothetical protein CHF27_012535 [Romboutsia maritimum]|uniref:DUF2326 domain-containing protein n=1 Tax=Romboutsia maritimum TaxID=2020948 RepID=A0A371IQ49_9FIRM|nr:DUF2326 domain-containing protein [Romboutsia maritimum]RDY22598.1 hypothetical protein CHF27_012535 [Romboutsia maritimum]